MTSEPLVDNELFEVRLDSKVSRWVGGLCIGATPKDSNSFAFPRSLPEFNKDVFMWCNNKIVYNAMERDVRENIMEMTVSIVSLAIYYALHFATGLKTSIMIFCR